MKSTDLYPAIFSRHAAAYARRLEQIMSRGEARGRRRVLDLLAPAPGMRVLDLACGPGTLTAAIAGRIGPDGEVVGVDLAEGMIEVARAAQIPNARFEVMDMAELAFPDQSFDAAACGHGLQFASDLGRVLSEVRRVLRPGGRFAASVPVNGASNPDSVALDAVIDRWLPPAPEAEDRRATQAMVGDRDAFRAAALGAGFQSAGVELVEGRARWDSPEQYVALLAGWWSMAARLETVSDEIRESFTRDAVDALGGLHAGPFETHGRDHVILALAPLS